jgi:anion-transporting  ArsA/GET3 family ATPase
MLRLLTLRLLQLPHCLLLLVDMLGQMHDQRLESQQGGPVQLIDVPAEMSAYEMIKESRKRYHRRKEVMGCGWSSKSFEKIFLSRLT